MPGRRPPAGCERRAVRMPPWPSPSRASFSWPAAGRAWSRSRLPPEDPPNGNALLIDPELVIDFLELGAIAAIEQRQPHQHGVQHPRRSHEHARLPGIDEHPETDRRVPQGYILQLVRPGNLDQRKRSLDRGGLRAWPPAGARP